MHFLQVGVFPGVFCRPAVVSWSHIFFFDVAMTSFLTLKINDSFENNFSQIQIKIMTFF